MSTPSTLVNICQQCIQRGKFVHFGARNEVRGADVGFLSEGKANKKDLPQYGGYLHELITMHGDRQAKSLNSAFHGKHTSDEPQYLFFQTPTSSWVLQARVSPATRRQLIFRFIPTSEVISNMDYSTQIATKEFLDLLLIDSETKTIRSDRCIDYHSFLIKDSVFFGKLILANDNNQLLKLQLALLQYPTNSDINIYPIEDDAIGNKIQKSKLIFFAKLIEMFASIKQGNDIEMSFAHQIYRSLEEDKFNTKPFAIPFYCKYILLNFLKSLYATQSRYQFFNTLPALQQVLFVQFLKRLSEQEATKSYASQLLFIFFKDYIKHQIDHEFQQSIDMEYQYEIRNFNNQLEYRV